MADFPPNLDDCELYLPSDIYPDEIYYKNSAKFTPDENYHKPSSKFSPFFPSELTYMEELAAYSTLNLKGTVDAAKPLPNLPRNLERYGPAPPGVISTISPQRRGYGFAAFATAGRNLTSFGNGGFCTGSKPIYQHCPAKPAHFQFDSFVDGRGRVLQSRPNQSLSQNQFLPLQASGFGREYGGTGVFLPRVVHANVGKKPYMKSGEQRQAIESLDALKHGMTIQAPSDWTYFY